MSGVQASPGSAAAVCQQLPLSAARAGFYSRELPALAESCSPRLCWGPAPALLLPCISTVHGDAGTTSRGCLLLPLSLGCVGSGCRMSLGQGKSSSLPA